MSNPEKYELGTLLFYSIQNFRRYYTRKSYFADSILRDKI